MLPEHFALKAAYLTGYSLTVAFAAAHAVAALYTGDLLVVPAMAFLWSYLVFIVPRGWRGGV